MIYPQNFEQKIGFDSIRHLLKEKCLSTLGQERVDEMNFSESFKDINKSGTLPNDAVLLYLINDYRTNNNSIYRK